MSLVPEGYQEILTALVESRIRDGSEPARQKLARELAARGVEARDIKAAVQRAVEVDEVSIAQAARMVAAQLASAETWPAYATASRDALRRLDDGKRGQDHEHGQSLKTTASEVRRKEFAAAGLSLSDANLVERGGFVHARVVGDDRVIGDVCREVALDPWASIQAAAWWADLFGSVGRSSFRRALARQIAQHRCQPSLLEHLDAVTVRTLDKAEPLVPWRRPTKLGTARPAEPRTTRPLTDDEAAIALEAIEEIHAKRQLATAEREPNSSFGEST